jgi:hypothetical protein
MDRRAFLAGSTLASFEGISLNSAAVTQVFADVNQATNNRNAQRPEAPVANPDLRIEIKCLP